MSQLENAQLQCGNEFFVNMIKTGLELHPYLGLASYRMYHLFDYVDAPIKRFLLCLVDMGYLDRSDYNAGLHLNITPTREALTGGFKAGSDYRVPMFAVINMETYITEHGVIELSGAIRHELKTNPSYRKRRKT